MNILRLPQVKEKTGLRSTSGVYQAMDEKGFPRPIPLGDKAVGWVEAEVERWLAERVAMRDDKLAARQAKRAKPAKAGLRRARL